MYIGEFVPWKPLKPLVRKHLGGKRKVEGVIAERRFAKTKGFFIIAGDELVLWKMGKYLNEDPKEVRSVSIRNCQEIIRKKGWTGEKIVLKSQGETTAVVCRSQREAAAFEDIMKNIRDNKKDERSSLKAKTRLMKITDSRYNKRAV